MALTNSERVKRWRNNHRDLHNSRRRQYHKNKNLSGGCNVSSTEAGGSNPRHGNVDDVTVNEEPVEKSTPSAQPFPCMISSSFIAESVDEPPPTIYRNGRGAVITKREWERQQEIERKAEAGGYEAGDYSQL